MKQQGMFKNKISSPVCIILTMVRKNKIKTASRRTLYFTIILDRDPYIP